MLRIPLVLAIALLGASCRTDSTTDLRGTDPIISKADLEDREACLHQEVARLLEPQNGPRISLHMIAATATDFCSRAIAGKLQEVSVSRARDDLVKTEQRAFAIGLELRERRVSR
jgi:hypothetical protein